MFLNTPSSDLLVKFAGMFRSGSVSRPSLSSFNSFGRSCGAYLNTSSSDLSLNLCQSVPALLRSRHGLFSLFRQDGAGLPPFEKGNRSCALRQGCSLEGLGTCHKGSSTERAKFAAHLVAEGRRQFDPSPFVYQDHTGSFWHPTSRDALLTSFWDDLIGCYLINFALLFQALS